MMKLKRMLALLGVILLVAMYGSTLFFAFSKHPDANGWLMAAIGCTIIIPVFLYAYMLVYKHLKGRKK